MKPCPPSRVPNALAEPLERRRLLANDPIVVVLDEAHNTSALRAAVELANERPGPDVIDMTGTPPERRSSFHTLVVTDDLTINGPGASVARDGFYLQMTGGSRRHFEVVGGSLTLRDLYLLGGSDGADDDRGGGAILVNGGEGLTLDRVVISGAAADGSGGAVNVGDADLLIRESEIAFSRVLPVRYEQRFGGAVYATGNVEIDRSTIAGSVAGSRLSTYGEAFGGGLALMPSAGKTVSIVNSTIAANEADRSGSVAGLYLAGEGSVEIVDTTIALNFDRNVNKGPIVRIEGGLDVTMTNVLVDGRVEVGPDVTARLDRTILSVGADRAFAGDNLVGSPAEPVDLALGELDAHGGFGRTVELLPGGAAINFGRDATAAGNADQRGVSLLHANDVGSFEYGNAPPIDVTIDFDRVVEGLVVGPALGRVSAVEIDLNAEDTHAYAVVGDGGPFTVDEAGVVWLAESPGPAGSRHALTVRATDDRGMSFEKTFQIDVAAAEASTRPGPKQGRAIVRGATRFADNVLVTADAEGRTVVTVNGVAQPLADDVEAVYLDTGDGDDRVVLFPTSVAVWVNAGAGDDDVRIHAEDEGGSFAVVRGGPGNDTLIGTPGNDALYGGEGDDYIEGYLGDDYLDGGAGDDTVIGGLGDDTVVGGAGSDLTAGSQGWDTVWFRDSASSVNVELGDPIGSAKVGDDRDRISGFDVVIGTQWGDRITGNVYANLLVGLGGDDVLVGRAGDDTLIGNDGDDEFYGDNGDDVLHVGRVDMRSTVRGGDGIDFAYVVRSTADMIDLRDVEDGRFING